jgi:hypothetical protein
MKIEVGKRYVRRDGSVTPVLSEDWVPGTGYAHDTESSFVYDTKGGPLDHQVFSYKKHPYDLISEYVE